MNVRKVTIFTGKTFKVPEGIQRIDTRYTHGWQLRYGGSTKMFSDFSNDGSGAKVALEKACKELLKRIEKIPAPTGLQQKPTVTKTSDLPVGISGPIYRQRQGNRVREANLSVSIPRYGQPPARRSVYIGNDNTYTEERFVAALQKAIEMRTKAERAYQIAATKAKRLAGRALLAK